MFVEEIRRAVQVCQRGRLPELSAAVWKGFAAGAVSEEDAQRLAELIEARKTVATAPAEPRRRVGSRPRSSGSIERRRRHSAAGWLPPTLSSHFTVSEVAALSVVAQDVLALGRCELSIGAIAAKAGTCATVVRNALRHARRLGLIAVETRRVRYNRNLPNVVTIVSAEWTDWLRIGARDKSKGGGCRFALPTSIHIQNSSARPAATAWKAGTFGEADRKVWAKRPTMASTR